MKVQLSRPAMGRRQFKVGSKFQGRKKCPAVTQRSPYSAAIATVHERCRLAAPFLWAIHGGCRENKGADFVDTYK
jgi:hypothetical protein